MLFEMLEIKREKTLLVLEIYVDFDYFSFFSRNLLLFLLRFNVVRVKHFEMSSRVFELFDFNRVDFWTACRDDEI